MFLLCVSLVLSLVFLLIANGAFLSARRPAVVIGICTVILPFAPLVLMTESHVVFFQGVILTITALLIARERPWRFAAASVAGTVVAYVIASTLAYLELHSLRATFPIESLETRLPIRSDATPVRLDTPSNAELSLTEDDVAWNPRGGSTLRNLHENAVEIFLSRAGFGVSRLYMGIDNALYRSDPLDPSPGMSSIEGSRDERPQGIRWAPLEFTGDLNKLHRESLPEFFRRGYGFGYFRDRNYVIGFRPHGFAERRWFAPQVRKVELIGLVVHPEPVVYLSGVPTMAKLATIPTRPLDAFETKGLSALREGHALFTAGAAKDLRMLGPIRAAKQCTECHGCERGQLLGAFSYTIRDTGS